MPTRDEWDEIGRKLREPFDPKDVDFRVQGRANEQTGRAQVVAYIDARAVQDRLDAVIGAGDWAFDWEPLVVEKGEVMVAKGILTIYGVSKSDAGSASNFEQSLGAVSHCFKRAAVHWGIGRYLYNIPQAWVAVEKGGRIPDAVLRELRAKLPRPNGNQQTQPQTQQEEAPQQPQQQAQTQQQNGRPFNPLQDVPFRTRCKALGYITVDQVQMLVDGLCKNGRWDLKGCTERLEAQEQRAAAVREKVEAH